MNEEWRTVTDFEGYEVSNLGRVRSLDRQITSSRGILRRIRGRVLIQSIDGNGRYVVTLCKDGRKYPTPVHKLVAQQFLAAKPTPKHEICHNDGECLNNLATNLRWGTRSENIQDRSAHGKDHNLNKTHCPQNHEYTEENTYVIPRTGGRMCRECKKEHSKQGWLKLKEKNRESRSNK